MVPVTHGSIVKFSRSEYALVHHPIAQLATAEHYRRFEGDGSGIQDPDDAVHREPLRRYLDRWNPDALSGLPQSSGISGTVTYQTDSSWLFCTSLPPRSLNERHVLKADFEADCMTEIADPAAFARELGIAVARMSPAPAVAHDGTLPWIQDRLLRANGVEQIVRIDHGPVIYADDAEDLIDAVPLQHRAAAVPFVKKARFAHQREHRFVVTLTGTPAQQILRVPMSDGMRELVETLTEG